MNHRRKRTTRREGNRIDHKRLRAAERNVIDGGKTKALRGDNWNHRFAQPPVGREVIQKDKSKPKAIKYCPGQEGNKRHHYLDDEEEVKIWIRFPWFIDAPSGYRVITRRYKLCVYCGDEKTVGRRY